MEDLRTVKLGGKASDFHCVYLFICLLFAYLLLFCLLFNYFNGAVCWFMHELCGLAPWGQYLCFGGLALA